MPIKRSRTLAILLLLGILLLVASILLLPLSLISNAYDDSIDDLTFQIQRYQRTAQREPQLRRQLVTLQARRLPASALLQGDSSAIAGANLQQLIKRRVQRAGGHLESTQILPGKESNILERIAIRAQFTGSMEALQNVLYKIEFGQPRLFIERIEIRKKSRFRRLRRKQTINQGQVRVTLQVAGYRRAGEERP